MHGEAPGPPTSHFITKSKLKPLRGGASPATLAPIVSRGRDEEKRELWRSGRCFVVYRRGAQRFEFIPRDRERWKLKDPGSGRTPRPPHIPLFTCVYKLHGPGGMGVDCCSSVLTAHLMKALLQTLVTARKKKPTSLALLGFISLSFEQILEALRGREAISGHFQSLIVTHSNIIINIAWAVFFSLWFLVPC